MSKTKTPPAKQAILEVLKIEPQASVAQVAVSAGIGRSTAGKLLAQLESDGEVRRADGGRDGKRRLPNLWSLAGQRLAATETDAKLASTTDGKPSGGATERLKPGELEPLVLAYLKENAASGPHGPTTVARAFGPQLGRGRQQPQPADEGQEGAAGQRQAPPLQPRGVALPTRVRAPHAPRGLGGARRGNPSPALPVNAKTWHPAAQTR